MPSMSYYKCKKLYEKRNFLREQNKKRLALNLDVHDPDWEEVSFRIIMTIRRIQKITEMLDSITQLR